MELERSLGLVKPSAPDAARQEGRDASGFQAADFPLVLVFALHGGPWLALERRFVNFFVLAVSLHTDILVACTIESLLGSIREEQSGRTGGKLSRPDATPPQAVLVAIPAAKAAAPAATPAVLGLVHPDVSSPELAPVESANRVVGCARVVHLDERKAARAAGLAIRDHVDRRNVTVARESGTKLFLRRREGEVSDIDLLAQLLNLAAPQFRRGRDLRRTPDRSFRTLELRRNGYRPRHRSFDHGSGRERQNRKEIRTGG
jgi:hypothetical protein